MFEKAIDFIQDIYQTKDFIPLHEPRFIGNEKKYLNECIDSNYVSSVGKFVDEFEKKIAKYVGTKYAIATTNGTSALHIALLLSKVSMDDEVITQPLTFVATCNAISYCGAKPIFLDVDKDTMGLSPLALYNYLKTNTIIRNQQCINNNTGNVIRACIPMHTFGYPCRIDSIKKICEEYKITLVEDAAESLGSYYKDQHTGSFGLMGVMSFNGNKIITAGGGGCIVTNDKELAKKAKHLTTTAKIPHKWDYGHDQIGYNYRMPNLNAALLLAQLENLDSFIINKKLLANKYKKFFHNNNIEFFIELKDSKPNYWLNSILLKNRKQRDIFLEETNSSEIMTRPLWLLMNSLKMFKDDQRDNLDNSRWLSDRVVNLPSSPIIHS